MRYIVSGNTETLAKRILFLAWSHAGVFGMGILQDRGAEDEENVWSRGSDSIFPQTEVGYVNADYLFGRMMKLRFSYDKNSISTRDTSDYRWDYQSFCHKYKNFDTLIKAAAETLKIDIVEEK